MSLPSLADLIAECAEVRTLAIEYKRVYRDRNGQDIEAPQPDYRAALAATELTAKLLGFVGAQGGNLTPAEAKRELEKLGVKVGKGKLKAVK